MLGILELTFIGDIIFAEEVKYDKTKIKAIEMMPNSQSKKEVQQFLGTVNFLGKFKPSLNNRE